MGIMSSTWSDSRVLSSTVASVSETEIGSVNIPANQQWLVTSVFGSHPQGGTFRVAVDSLPGMSGTFIQNSKLNVSLSDAGNGSADVYPQNYVISGPATLSANVTNAAATTGTAKFMINYQVTQG